MATSKKKQGVEPEISTMQMSVGVVTYRVIGSSPLILNRMSRKAMEELLFPAGQKTTADKRSRLKHAPLAEYRASPYTLPDGDALLALLSTAFKGAMMTAALDMPGTKKTEVGRLCYIPGEYVPIYGTPVLRMDVVRNSGMQRTPDIRTRACVRDWCAEVTVHYTKPNLRERSVGELLASAGITAGVGDYRPEKGKGHFGRFELVGPDNAERWEQIRYEGGREAQEYAMQYPAFYDGETEHLFNWWCNEYARRGFAGEEALQQLAAANGKEVT